MRLIWQWVQAHQPQHLPALALAAYCGIRDAELSRLQWSNINLTNRTVQLPSHVTKTKRRRMVEIPAEVAPTLERIYRLWRWTPGTPLRGTGFDVAVANARAAHALTTKRNGFRKSFVTYAVALGQKSVSQIAEECGHSESVLQSTYKGLATKEAAEAWFTSCCPPEPGREL
jgi:integrase